MCAWHGALTELLAQAGSHKTPAVTGRKGHALRAGGQQGKGSFQKWDVRRKHEAEPVYVANSEPTIWQRGGGRAGMTERGLISGEPNRGEVGRHMGRWCVLPRPPARRAYASERKPSCAGIDCCQRYHKTEPNRRTRSGAGHRRWQIRG